MEKVTETKIYERFRVGGQIPVCGPVSLAAPPDVSPYECAPPTLNAVHTYV